MKWVELPGEFHIDVLRICFITRLWIRFPDKEERKTVRRESRQWAKDLLESAKRKEEWLASNEKRPLKSEKRLLNKLLDDIRKGKIS